MAEVIDLEFVDGVQRPQYLNTDELRAHLRYRQPRERTPVRRYGVMEVIDATGDTQIIWDREDADGVDAARLVFNTLMGRGHAAFALNIDGTHGETQVREFRPDAERLVMVPQIQGGV